VTRPLVPFLNFFHPSHVPSELWHDMRLCFAPSGPEHLLTWIRKRQTDEKTNYWTLTPAKRKFYDNLHPNNNKYFCLMTGLYWKGFRWFQLTAISQWSTGAKFNIAATIWHARMVCNVCHVGIVAEWYSWGYGWMDGFDLHPSTDPTRSTQQLSFRSHNRKTDEPIGTST